MPSGAPPCSHLTRQAAAQTVAQAAHYTCCCRSSPAVWAMLVAGRASSAVLIYCWVFRFLRLSCFFPQALCALPFALTCRPQKRAEQSSIHFEKAAIVFNLGAVQVCGIWAGAGYWLSSSQRLIDSGTRPGAK